MDQFAVAQPDALLEREHEVEHIRAALRAVGQRAGRALIIEGAGGIGSHGCSMRHADKRRTSASAS